MEFLLADDDILAGMSERVFAGIVKSIAELIVAKAANTDRDELLKSLNRKLRLGKFDEANVMRSVEEVKRIHGKDLMSANRSGYLFVKTGQYLSDRGAKRRLAQVQENPLFAEAAVIFAAFYEKNPKSRELTIN